MYIKLNNGQIETYPYSIGQLRKDNPNTSFPKNIPNNVLAEFGVYPVQDTPQPSSDYTKNVTEGTPVNQGGWKRTWTVANATAAEIQERTASQASNVRAERDQKLVDTDWTQVADVPVNKTAWATYRQALRDISKQSGFPWNITWPAEPE